MNRRKTPPSQAELEDLMAEALTDEGTGRPPSPTLRREGLFIRGPFNETQLLVVANLGRAPLVCWILVHHLIRLKRRSDILLPNKLLAVAGIDRHLKYRALKKLERHGFIQLTRIDGCALRVSLVELSKEESDGLE
jgi:hypothetical protein